MADYDDIELFHMNAIAKLNELRQLDANRLLSGGVSTMEEYNNLIGRINALNDCQTLLTEILRSFNES